MKPEPANVSGVARRAKVLHWITLLAAAAALVVSIIAVSTPGPRGDRGPQGNSGPVGTDGPRGAVGPRGPRGRAGDTAALEEQIAALERKVDLVQQVQGTEGLESPDTTLEEEVPAYSGGGDLDCADFAETDFPTPPGDPDGLDGDGDGIACES